ncbi:hypothetical protein L7F22_027990 [Adiantum nelumboides]|nr:hypothetical protein [Adiantum nelumboides]
MLLPCSRVLGCGVAQKSHSPLQGLAASATTEQGQAGRQRRSHRASLDLSRKDWLAALKPLQSLAHETTTADDKLVEGVTEPLISEGTAGLNNPSFFVFGIDPDASGAMAVLRGDDATLAEVVKQQGDLLELEYVDDTMLFCHYALDNFGLPTGGSLFSVVPVDLLSTGTSHQVFDVPTVRVMVGSGYRRRHDPGSLASMIKELSAPIGSVAYIEQNSPMPKDGKQGWWGSGFGYGMWIGTLVASGISVVPVSSVAWKRAMGLLGKDVTKDDCRACASLIFPSLAPQLKRKKDHGRAEALLIAAYAAFAFKIKLYIVSQKLREGVSSILKYQVIEHGFRSAIGFLPTYSPLQRSWSFYFNLGVLTQVGLYQEKTSEMCITAQAKLHILAQCSILL